MSGPIFIEDDNIAAFDVDGTLVNYEPTYEGQEPISFDNFGITEYLYPMQKHINLMIKFKNKKKFIIVWSQNGAPWAKQVVNKLGLDKYVNLIMTKPTDCVDDLPPQEWMRRIYLGE